MLHKYLFSLFLKLKRSSNRSPSYEAPSVGSQNRKFFLLNVDVRAEKGSGMIIETEEHVLT